MRNPHQIAIVFLSILLAGSPFPGASANGESGIGRAAERPRDLDSAPHAWKAATTSEPPGPGSPTIPGGPGPLPDDDDDDGAALRA
ncbi:MAG: hypothetical protein AB7F74_25400 [Parvibaculaceae bacterium]